MKPSYIIGLGVGAILAASWQNPYLWYVLIGIALILYGIQKLERISVQHLKIIEGEQAKQRKQLIAQRILDEWQDTSDSGLGDWDSDSLTDQNRPGATTHD